MLNGRCSYLYFLIGVLKVVRYDDFLFSLIWRNFDLVFSLEKIQVLGMFDIMFLIVFMGW